MTAVIRKRGMPDFANGQEGSHEPFAYIRTLRLSFSAMSFIWSACRRGLTNIGIVHFIGLVVEEQCEHVDGLVHSGRIVI